MHGESVFENNAAVPRGGVLAADLYRNADSSLAVYIANSEINHNKADNGGVVSIRKYSTFDHTSVDMLTLLAVNSLETRPTMVVLYT